LDIQKLTGKRIVSIHRAADMLCVQVGETISVHTRKDGKREIPEYGIHFQCQWRFVEKGEILLASHDIYNPYDPSLAHDDRWDWDVLGREKGQGSVFDARAREFAAAFLPLRIERIHMADTGDLRMDLEGDVCFDTFISCSTRREYYRFLDHHLNEHTVIFDED